MVREGVVNVPDAPLMPSGEEVQSPARDVQVITEVVLAAPYAIRDGYADTYIFGAAPLDCGPEGGMLPPHEAMPEIIDSTVKQTTTTALDLIPEYFDMNVSLECKSTRRMIAKVSTLLRSRKLRSQCEICCLS